MFYTIYKTTNLINGMIYIGQHQTENLDDDYYGSGVALHEAIKEFGSQNFSKEILFVFDDFESMDKKERELVTQEFVDRPDTYNMVPGGFNYGRTSEPLTHEAAVLFGNKGQAKHQYLMQNDPEYRERVLENIRIAQNNPNRLAKFRATMAENRKQDPTFGKSFLGKKHTEETKSRISQQAKARMANSANNPMYGKRWITNGVDKRLIGKDDLLPDGYVYGRVMPKEKIKKERTYTYIPVQCIETGVWYRDATECAIALNICVSSVHSQACGHRKDIRGYHFQYGEPYTDSCHHYDQTNWAPNNTRFSGCNHTPEAKEKIGAATSARHKK